jgi:hypothetical protein
MSLVVPESSPLLAYYEPGKWTKAKPEALHRGYGLFVYRNLNAALECMGFLVDGDGDAEARFRANREASYSKYELWEVLGMGTWPTIHVKPLDAEAICKGILDPKYAIADEFPDAPYILMAQAVKLVRRVI